MHSLNPEQNQKERYNYFRPHEDSLQILAEAVIRYAKQRKANLAIVVRSILPSLSLVQLQDLTRLLARITATREQGDLSRSRTADSNRQRSAQ
jgi:hypothetical protein